MAVGHASAAMSEVGIGHALPRDIERGAVIGRCADEGQPSVTFTPRSKSSVLIGDERLIVIHGDGRVIARARARHGTSCRPKAARADRSPRRATASSTGRDHLDLLTPHAPALARMRVEPGHGEARRGDAEIADQGGMGDADRLSSRSPVSAPAPRQRDMDGRGHHPQADPASIIATRSTPARCARYSVWPGKANPAPSCKACLWMGAVQSARGLARLHQSTPRAITSITPCACAGLRLPGVRGPAKGCASTGKRIAHRRGRVGRRVDHRTGTPSGRCAGSPMRKERHPPAQRAQALAAISGPMPAALRR